MAFQLFPPDSEEYAALQEMVRDIEETVFNEEQIDAGYSLYDIEMLLESNPDYYAYFKKDNGSIVTKFDVERQLNKIKAFIYAKVRERATGRKFQRYR